jgi:carbonic anhydrase/acetyltransferase-like protein (isoleucine patch superfamily)
MPIDPSAAIAPTARVHAQASIGPRAVIGEYCVIEEEVTIGADCRLEPYVYVKRWTTLGERNEISAGTVLGTDPLDKNFTGERSYLRIGNGNNNGNNNNAKDKDRVVVRMLRWEKGDKRPVGEVIAVMDAENSNDAAMKEILLENGFPLEFPDDALEVAARIPETISKEEINKRRDVRDILTFTIDPRGLLGNRDTPFTMLVSREHEVPPPHGGRHIYPTPAVRLTGLRAQLET